MVSCHAVKEVPGGFSTVQSVLNRYIRAVGTGAAGP